MSRKNYRAVAALVAAEWWAANHQAPADAGPGFAEGRRYEVRELALALARIFSDDNPRFSVQRFYEACECGLSDAEKSADRLRCKNCDYTFACVGSVECPKCGAAAPYRAEVR